MSDSLNPWDSKTQEEIELVEKEARDISNEVIYNKQVEKEDKVNHPSHYTWLKKLCGIEVIDITRHMCFNLGNVVKYILRAGHKSEKGYSDQDKEIEDLKKAKWYLEDEINLRTNNKSSEESVIKALQTENEELRNTINKLSEANYHLRKVQILGKFTLSRAEIFKAAEIIKATKTDNCIKFEQGSTGIGIGTHMFVSENSKEYVDITDYDSW